MFLKGSRQEMDVFMKGSRQERMCSGKKVDRKGCVHERKYIGKDVFLKESV